MGPDHAALLEAFRGALHDEVRAALDASGDAAAVQQWLVAWVRVGAQAWPTVRTPPTELAAALGARLDGRDAVHAQLEPLQAADLFLALACGLGDGSAVAAFEAAHGGLIQKAVIKAGGSSHGVDDLAQRVREKLFVSDGDRPARICAYSGRGSLAGWVRVTSVRTVLDVVRWDGERRRRVDVDARVFEQVGAAEVSPEADYLRVAHADKLPAAMRAAFEALTARQRNLLRHRFFYGLSTDGVAKLYGVHRATAYRWLEGARIALFEGTREAIKRDLAVSGQELESLMHAFASRIDISMGQLLGRSLETER
ncbi:MAG: sigma-70 family RNA polymerase sigma factor [Myxococcota bacterium]